MVECRVGLSSPTHGRQNGGCSHVPRPTQPCPAMQKFNLPFPPTSSPRTFPTISVKTMARELQMGTANVRSEQSKQEKSLDAKSAFLGIKHLQHALLPLPLSPSAPIQKWHRTVTVTFLIQSLWKQKQADLSTGPAWSTSGVIRVR